MSTLRVAGGAGPLIQERLGRLITPAGVGLTRRLLGESGKVTAWLWPLAVLIASLVGFLIARFSTVTASIWENAGQWPCWFLFATAISLVTTYLPIAVAHGVTRRAALAALGICAAVTTVVWAGLMVLGQVAEQALYDRLNWSYALRSPHLFTDGYDVAPMFAEYVLVFLGYVLAGTLVGAAYYRLGWLRATALLPLTLLPAVAIEVLLSTGWYGAALDMLSFAGRPALPIQIAASLAVVLASGGAIQLILRDVPITARHG